ncbi:MAG TPA: TcfC E-set like domain-containing protein [Pseudomonadales bacterium]|nr:TcfC E-set like domain-containing protein [Pseudomonadales bacterium]
MRRPPGVAILLAAAIVLAGAGARAETAEPVFRATSKPPPGFEAFFERQQTVVDVYYAGRFLSTAQASYDIGAIRFDDPAALVAQIPDLIEPARVVAALSGDLDTHAAALCGRSPDKGCGRLAPEVAAVIFDASRFHATLFVAPEQLATRGPDIRRFLPPSDSDFSYLQNLSATLSGGTGDSEDAYNLTSLTSVSHGEIYTQIESSYGSEDDLTIDQAFTRREFEGRALQGGLYRSRGRSSGFVRERDLVGVRAESSLDTRTDRAFSGGTPVEVFLPTRSRVEILQDGRLLNSGSYDAGNRVLDTSNLPDGAYDIDLRIIESGGTVRSERRFFVKTTRLPPEDQPLWTLEAGRIFDRGVEGALPKDTGDWLARVNTTRRIAEGLGIDGGLAAGLGDALLEAGVFKVGRFGEIQASGFASAEGALGLAMLARLQVGALRGNADYRRLSGSEEDGLAGADLEQIGANVSMPLYGGVLGLSTRFEERADGTSRKAQSLSWDRYIARSRRGGLRLAVDLNRQDEDWVGLLSLQVDFRDGGINASVQPSARVDRFDDGDSELSAQTDARLAWDGALRDGGRARVGIDGTHGDRERRIGTEGLYEGRAGTLRGNVDRNLRNGGETSWTGSLNTSLLGDGARLSLGGRDNARAATLVEIDGDVPDASFEVLVDGYSRGIAPAGSVTPIHLRPWETYDIRLRPIGAALIAWENREEHVTLYPGNVVRLRWEIAEIVVLLGRIRDADGAPVAGAQIDGAYGFAMTEASGLFQAEVERPPAGTPIELTVTARGAEPCTVRLDTDGMTSRKGILRVGTLTCLP